jgi:hypothetical protein
VNAPQEPPESSHLRFTETMRGRMTFGADTTAGAAEHGFDLAVRLTVEIGGVERFLADPRHEALLTGWVFSDALGGRLPIESGVFNLLVYERDPDVRQMLYRVHFRDGAGHRLTLAGEKRVPGPATRHLWRDTTTLVTQVLRGPETVAAGVLRITLPAFLRQLTTFRASGPGRFPPLVGAGLVARYSSFFVTTLGRVYLR